MNKQGEKAVLSLKTWIKENIGFFDLLWIFLLGALVRLWLIITYPGTYGGDTIFRVTNSDWIFLAYNLPLLQFLIYLTAKLSSLPFAISGLMILIGSVGCCSIYLLTTKLFDRTVARLAAILFITNPFILVYSLVPYQEILMISLLFLAVYFFMREEKRYDMYLASFFIGMACLTRYEGWIVGAFLAFISILRKFDRNDWRLNFKTAFLAGLLFCWAPILWILLNGGINPEGTFVLEKGFTLGRLIRIPYVIAKIIYHSTPAIALTGLIGFIALVFTEKRKDKKLLAVMGYLLLFIITLTIWGHDFPPDTNLVTEREIHIPICLFLICAAYGICEIFKWIYNFPGISRAGKFRGTFLRGIVTATMLLFIVSIPLKKAYNEVSARSSDPGLRVSYSTAQFIDKTMKKNEKALILAKEYPKPLIESSLQRRFGEDNLNAESNARKIVDLFALPPDYQRLVVESKYGKNELITPYFFRNLNEAETAELLKKKRFNYLVVFSDFTPEYPSEEFILKPFEGKKEFLTQIGDDVKYASIYRVSTP
jgi:hypothetical protein